MERSQGEAGSPERVRFRLTFLQNVVPILPSLIGFTLYSTAWWGDGASVPPYLVGMVFWAVLACLGLLVSRGFGVTLTPSEAVVHGLHRRTVRWADVQAVRIESFAGSRTVVLYEAGGRTTRLRAPISGFLNWDRRFEEKFHTIGRWWLEHRGPDWTYVPPAATWWNAPPPPDGNPFAPPV
ncbi:hypothetical protein [Streptomyces mangrovisoli]|uniref:PH domain-containing protein n=1 Tax=Streptomyces mangrovisoli TaxID=1428628 RepID=A0A1J4NMG5_9ACTN|nr:hypothetical protein [Streptomyces mangrovisoli]OIJ63338.1 hypothetical protein WN71_034845 [Streptomyces mangrovisoli]